MSVYTDWDLPQDFDDPLTDWDDAPPTTPGPPRVTYPVGPIDSPERFLAEIHKSHIIATKARVLSGHHVLDLLRISGGAVTVDGTQSVRRTATLKVIDPTGNLIVDSTNDLLAPLGPEIKLWRGVRYLDGTEHLVPLGVFGIYDVETGVTTDEGTEITLTLNDRSMRLKEAAWIDPWQAPAAVDYADAITALIADRLEDPAFRFQPTGHLTPPNLIFGADGGGDPLEDAIRMADSVGFDLAPDVNGTWALAPVATRSDALVDTYQPGEAKLLSVKKNWTRDDTYSIVVVTGERAGNVPIQSVSRDTDPDSPTYWRGIFGAKTFRFTAEFITTQAQADQSADAWLARKAGASEILSFTAVVNPTLDAGDVVRVINDDAKVDSRYILDTFTIPLTAEDPTEATSRARRVIT